MNKSTVIVLLAGVNLCLLACLVLTTYSPPAAAGQVAAGEGQYILVAGEAKQHSDIIYLLDVGRRQLHAFGAERSIAPGQAVTVRWFYSRDLKHDFR